MRPSARCGKTAATLVLSGVLSALKRVSRHGRNIDTLGAATKSGAMAAKSMASRSIVATIGACTCASYSARRSWNHSRRLLRLRARRNRIVRSENTGASGMARSYPGPDAPQAAVEAGRAVPPDRRLEAAACTSARAAPWSRAPGPLHSTFPRRASNDATAPAYRRPHRNRRARRGLSDLRAHPGGHSDARATAGQTAAPGVDGPLGTVEADTPAAPWEGGPGSFAHDRRCHVAGRRPEGAGSANPGGHPRPDAHAPERHGAVAWTQRRARHQRPASRCLG